MSTIPGRSAPLGSLFLARIHSFGGMRCCVGAAQFLLSLGLGWRDINPGQGARAHCYCRLKSVSVVRRATPRQKQVEAEAKSQGIPHNELAHGWECL